MQLGGTELNAIRTIEHLDRDRFSVIAVSLQDQGPLLARYADAGVPVHVFTMKSLYSARAVQQGLRLAALFRRERIDIVHSHDAYTSVYATIWARVARVRAVIASRRSWHSPHLQGRILQANRVAYRHVDVVVGNSPSVSELVRTEGGVVDGRSITIPNFLDDAAYQELAPAEKRRHLAELGVPEGAFVVGILARLAPEKDHPTLFRAVELLKDRIPDLHLVLVGGGPERPALESLARSMQLTSRIHFAGQRSPTPNLHSLFDVSVLCSTSEAFSNSILEAMAVGRPMIATDVGGNPDAVQHDKTGLLVPAGDHAKLAEAIERLHSDPAYRLALGEGGRAEARRSYHSTAVIPQVEALYTRLGARRAV
jgi:glycosyltransferase involved in cell wall biosynthesis